MKQYLLTGLLLLVIYFSQAMPDKQISIKSFGAKGDGKTNDHEAFQKASDYINKQGSHVTLIIPYGTYIVGQQTPGKEWLLEGADVIHLNGCKDILIKGIPKNGKFPILKYKNGLYFGSFYGDGDKKFTPKCSPAAGNYNKKTCANIGACFYIFKCDNIRISSIEIDGNQNGMILGGTYGDKGYQLNHRGFYLVNSQQTTLNDIFVHHTALDGVEVAGSENTLLTRVVSSYNGRQGLSWIEGNGLKATDCKFNNTGNARISSAPGAGMDIEPEENSDIRDGVFDRCEFMNNMGCAVVNDKNKFYAANISFNRCAFLGYHNFALWVCGKKFRFNDCKIYGFCTNAIKAADVKTPDDLTSFKRCLFSNTYKNKLTKKVSGYMLEFNNQSVDIEDCRIESYNVGFMWHSGGTNPEIAKSHISRTTILTDNTKGYHCSTSGITFSDCTISYTEKVDISLFGANPLSNTIRALPLTEMQSQMKSAAILPYVNLINPYICTEK